MGINTTSFDNTPQAVGDTFTSATTGLTEDSLFVTYLAVMANDLGGAAKTLYSLDDGTNSIGVLSPVDLLTQDIVRTEALTADRSAQGAKIWITADGKVGYDAHTLSSAFQDQLQHLSPGQFLTDTFTYAIRLGNGTLSWATATVQIAGVNDAPVVSGAVTGHATEEAAVVTLDALANASDVDDGTTLSVTGVPASLPAGVSYDAATHSFTLDPSNTAYQHLAAGQTTDVIVNYGVSDGSITTAASVKFTVTGTNDAPVAVARTDAATEGAAVITGNVVATDIDDGTTLTYSLTSSAPAGLTFHADGSYSFDPTVGAYDHLAAGATQDVVVSFKANDGTADSNVATLTITVTGTNDAPVAQAKTDAATEGSAVITGNVVATDADDGATLSYSLTGSAPAGLTFHTDGSYSFDPTVGAYDHLAAGATQDVVVSYKANDGTADSNVATLTITVTGTNDAPIAQAKTDAATEGAAVITGIVVATDVDDGTTLTYSLTGSAPAGLTFHANGSYSFDPTVGAYDHLAAGAAQDVVVSFKSNDGLADSNVQTLTITVTGTNDAPVAQAKTDAATEGAAVITGNVVATDVDDGASLTYSLTSAAPAGFTFHADGSYSFDPTVGAYDHLAAGATQDVVVGYKANDGTADSNVATLTITVTGTNDAPVAQAKTDAATEGAAVITGNVVATDVDDGTTLTYSLTSAAPAGLTFHADGSYSFDPTVGAYDHLAAGATQDVVVSYKANDGTADSNVATLTITVTGTNDAPVAQAKTDAATEGAAVITGNVVATDVDDGASLTYSLTSAAPSGFTFHADGSYSFDPTVGAYDHLAAGATQDVVVSFKANDGTANSNVATLIITVTGTNDAPVAQAKTDAATEGAAVITGNVVATDVDDGASLTYSLTSSAPAGLTFHANGSYSFDPTVGAYDHLAAGATQDVVVSFKANDGLADSNVQTLTITVTGTNDAPVAQAKTDAATEGAAVITGNVVATDVDDGASLTYSLTSAAPSGFTFHADGSYSFDPTVGAYDHLAAGATQDVVVSYKANDGMADSNVQTLTITVTGTNDAPVLSGTQATLAAGSEDAPYTVTAANLLAGFTDVDGDTLSVSGLTANHGTVVDNGNGTFTITPTANYNGSVGLSYNVVDGHGGSVAATESFNLAAVNDAPALTGTQATLGAGTEDTPYTVSATSLLAGFSDVDGDALSVSGLTANHGTVVDNGNGTFTITPTANYNGSVGLSYNVVDGHGGSVAASESFSLAAVNDAPVSTNDAVYVSNGTSVVIAVDSLLANDTDIDGLDLTMLSVGGATSGIQNLTLNANGTITFDSKNPGSESFTYVVSDNAGGTSTGTVAVNIVSTSGGSTVDLHLNNYQAAYLDGGSNSDALTGGTAPDTFIGGSGDDTLIGGAGNDTLHGGVGNDTIDGGAGTDLLDFSDASAAIAFTLVQSSSNTNVNLSAVGLGTDTYKNVEGVIGSAFNDTLTGSSSNDVIRGGAGNDTIDGGAGTDLLDFSDASGAITFTLTQSSSNTGVNLSGAGLGTDTYKNMEGVVGSAFNDTLTGSSGADVLKGGDGNDTILGGAGNDTIAGGSGADVLTGGLGSDTFMYLKTDAVAVDTITDFDTSVGGDMLGIGDLLSGYSAANAAQFVSFRESGSNTIVSVDRDGAGGAFGFQDLVVLQGVTGLDFGTLIAHVDPTPLP